MHRVLLHLNTVFDITTLLPVYREMERDHGFEPAMTFTPREPGHRSGLGEKEVAALRMEKVAVLENADEWRPDTVLTADLHIPPAYPNAKTVLVPRGLSSEGRFYAHPETVHRLNRFDLVCVPGRFHHEKITHSGKVFSTVVVTGLPKLDLLFRNVTPVRDIFRRMNGLAPDKAIVLYAPSQVTEFSAVPILWTRIRRVAGTKRTLIINLHDLFSREALRRHKALNNNDPEIHFSTAYDPVSLLKTADVMIADIGSAYLEALALDLPVVLLDNPNAVESPRFDPESPEIVFRDACIRTGDLQGVLDGVRHSLRKPGELAELRGKCAAQLLRKPDGEAARQVVEAVRGILETAGSISIPTKPEVVVVVPLDSEKTDSPQLEVMLDEILERSGLETEIVIALADSATLQTPQSITKRYGNKVRTCPLDPEAIQEEIGEVKFVACIRPGSEFGDKALLRLLNYLRSEPEVDIVYPLAIGGSPFQDPVNRLGIELEPGNDILPFDRYLQTAFAGRSVAATVPGRPDFMVSRNRPEPLQSLLAMLVDGAVPVPGSRLRAVVALDTVIRTADGRLPDPLEVVFPVGDELRLRIEQRIKELSSCIGMTLSEKPANAAPTKRDGPENRHIHGNGHLRLALHFHARGEKEKAKQHLETALRDFPDDPEALSVAEKLGLIPELRSTSGPFRNR